MTDGDALFRLAVESDDDTVRMAFADWLQERDWDGNLLTVTDVFEPRDSIQEPEHYFTHGYVPKSPGHSRHWLPGSLYVLLVDSSMRASPNNSSFIYFPDYDTAVSELRVDGHWVERVTQRPDDFNVDTDEEAVRVLWPSVKKWNLVSAPPPPPPLLPGRPYRY